MHEDQHAAQVALLRAALAGLLAQAKCWIPECAPADGLSVTLSADGSIAITYTQDDKGIAGEGD